MSEHWSDALLDEMREQGDLLADGVIARIFADEDIGGVNRLMASLVTNDGVPPTGLPPVVADYLAATATLPAHDPADIAAAEALFAKHGPEVLMALGFYALPASYAARKGVQVLYRTAYLAKRPMRRVFETTQMVIDVLSPGGLAPGGAGVRTAQKVRLMHAAVRHLLLHDPRSPWDASLGVPINQEDLAGTLMTFSFLVLDGLSRLHVKLTDGEQDAYQRAWAVVARVLGIHEAMIPSTAAAAKEMTTRIYERQIEASPEGVALTAALLEGYASLVPLEVLAGVPRSLIHYFLDHDPISGKNIRELLGVPEAGWSETFIRASEGIIGATGVNPLCLATRRYGLAMVDAMVSHERGGVRAPFAIPPDLRALWSGQGASS